MKQYGKIGIKVLLLCVVTAMMTAAVYAMPANPVPQQVTQADGTVITVTHHGDEFFNWTEEDNGYIVCYDDVSKNWCYADLNENNELVPGSSAVGCEGAEAVSSYAKSKPGLTFDDIRDEAEKTAESARERSMIQAEDSDGLYADSSDAPASDSSYVVALSNNEQDLVLMLIEYTDVKMVNDMDFWTNRYFGTEGKTVNTYYKEQSGDMNLQFKQISFTAENGSVALEDTSVISEIELKNGVAKVKFNKPHPASDALVDEDVITAFSYVNDYIDFTKYTKDAMYNDFILQEYMQVAAVVAGWEASAEDNDRTQKVWAHANYWYFGEIYDRTQISVSTVESTMNGVTYPQYSLFSYMVHGELYGGDPASGTAQTVGLGVSVHEMGHCLGMPDLYDLGYDSGALSIFSVMGVGSWGAAEGETQGETPVGFDAWSKIELGFASPIVVSTDKKNETYDLSSSADNHTILKLTSSVNSSQYFLVENRQFTGYDAGFLNYGLGQLHNNGGISIYHIDEDVITSGKSPTSNKYHYGVGLVFADGSSILQDSDYRWFYYNSPFFTLDGYDEFSSATTPGTQFYVDGHDSTDITATNYTADYACHSKTVESGISLKVLSNSGEIMTVLVNDASIVCGDVDSDGSVTAADRMLLARYLANWNGYGEDKISRIAADVNQDGELDSNDIQILDRYFAGWEGYNALPVQQ